MSSPQSEKYKYYSPAGASALVLCLGFLFNRRSGSRSLAVGTMEMCSSRQQEGAVVTADPATEILLLFCAHY